MIDIILYQSYSDYNNLIIKQEERPNGSYYCSYRPNRFRRDFTSSVKCCGVDYKYLKKRR